MRVERKRVDVVIGLIQNNINPVTTVEKKRVDVVIGLIQNNINPITTVEKRREERKISSEEYNRYSNTNRNRNIDM